MDYDLSKARALASNNKVAAHVFRVLSKRARPRRNTDLRRLKSELLAEGVSIDQESFDDIFRALDKMGVGTFHYAKPNSGTISRFEWTSVTSTRFALSALGRAAPVESVDVETAPDNRHHLSVPIGPGRIVTVSVPKGLNREQAEILASLVKNCYER